MAKQGLTVTIHIEGIRETLAALRELPKDASNELRDASQRLSESLATDVQSAARAEGRQAAILAKTVRARRDRVPVIVAGGMTRIGRNRKPAYKLLFGSEFGASQEGRYALKQFKPHLGRGSYWFFKTVEDKQTEIASEWGKAADDVVRRFGEGG